MPSLAIRFLNGDLRGSSQIVDADFECMIGRDPTCGIVLDDTKCSKRHARIFTERGLLILEDLQSTNGTYVNGVKITRQTLNERDTITIGSVVVAVECVSIARAGTAFDSGHLYARVMKKQVPFAKADDCMHEMPILTVAVGRISEILSHHTDAIIKDSLKVIFDVLPVTRLSVSRIEDGVLTQGYTLTSSGISSRQMSSTFARKVLDANKAILLHDAADQNTQEWGVTLMEQDVRSVIGVPIFDEGIPAAVLIADNLENPEALAETHVRILEYVSKVITVLYQRDAISKLEHIGSFLPICSSCKRVRDDAGYWEEIEHFIQAKSDVQFSHGICDECARRMYPDFFD